MLHFSFKKKRILPISFSFHRSRFTSLCGFQGAFNGKHSAFLSDSTWAAKPFPINSLQSPRLCGEAEEQRSARAFRACAETTGA
jgi:hypothetical protein